MNLLKRINLVYLFVIVISFSCSDDNKDEIKETPQTELKPLETTVPISYEFIPPSTLQVASIFKKAGLIYNTQLTNSREKVDNYSTKFEQSLAFGVYSSDLTYSVVHEKYSEAANFLKSLRTLGNKIGLETVFNSEDITVRFENNLGVQDSIIDILIYIQDNTDDYIKENGKVDLSVIYYTGAWIEGMFLGANTILEDHSKNSGILISEQMTIGEILLKGLEHIKHQDHDITDLIDSIHELLNTFYEFESVKKLGKDAEYIDFSLTEEETILISNKIIELRETIVH